VRTSEDPADPRSLIRDRPSLRALREAAAGCRGCGLYRNATQAVFGEGRAGAEVMLVGEQPGDQEDRRGKPFVGPAGRELDRALEEAGVDREKVYVTNVVKHFKFTPRGKRRIHKKPNAEEISACRPWLEAEVAVVNPRLIVALGATAAQALLGRGFRITKQRGEFFPSELGPEIMATIHPSAVIRAPGEERREQHQLFVRDLTLVAGRLGG
jgi:uracil-DNA glycosylase family protein